MEHKTCNFDAPMIAKAIEMILQGNCKKVDLGLGTKVYEVKNVIRIDLKVEELE